jgi:TBC1 domain family member 8/9
MYLGAISRFMANAFEYGDALLPPTEDGQEPQIEPNQPYLNLATFRMVVLAEEALEAFFETDLRASFKLEQVPAVDLPPASPSGILGGLGLGGLWSSITSDDSKKMFHKLSDDIGRAVGRHQVTHMPSIGRFTNMEEPRPRESLLTPSMRRSASRSSLSPTESSTTAVPSSPSSSSLLSATTTVRSSDAPRETAGLQPPVPKKSHERDAESLADNFSALSMVQAANAALMERTPFAIDDAKDDDEESDLDSEVAVDDGVMDEVFLTDPR